MTPEQEKEVGRAVERIYAMDDQQRSRLFATLDMLFCLHCGSADPRCQCSNDE